MSHIVTTFKDIHSTSTPFHRPVEEVLERIRSGEYKDLVEKIRGEEDKETRNQLKKGLLAICFSGEFNKRAANAIIRHSGLICLDFDGFKTEKDMLQMKKALQEDSFTYSVFISPSGKGLKVLTKIPAEIENHKSYFLALEEYHSCDEFDSGTKDVSRVCYASYDPKIFINEDAEVWTEKQSTKDLEVDARKPISVVTITDSIDVVQKLKKWWEAKYPMAEGGRNNNIHVLAAALNQYGISEENANHACAEYQAPDFKMDEIRATIRSAYKLYAADHGTKKLEDREMTDRLRRDIKSGANKQELKEELTSKGIDPKEAESIIEHAESIANEHVQIFWSKNDKGVVKMVHHLFREFLEDNGFYKFYPEGSDNFIFVRKVSNRVQNVTDQQIKDFVLRYIEDKIKDMAVWNFFADKTRFFKEDFLSFLHEIQINFVKDDESTSYLFFRNTAVKVSKKKIETIEYEDLPGWVWEDQMIDRDFDECDGSLCEFRKFVGNISGNESLRTKSIESAIGYMLHDFYHAGKNPAVILNDEVISDNPEGGTGKGIFATALGHIRKSVEIDGKAFSFDSSFPYQTVQQDTQILVFDDVKANFAFERLFSVITQGITIEKKNKDAIKIPKENSPKIMITTNYAIKGEGNSHDRRRFELEFKQHYKKDFTPVDEFGHVLFSDWSDHEWCIFDNYMISCLQGFLNTGLVESEHKNLKTRKFIQNTSIEFWEWAKDKDASNQLATETKHFLSQLHVEFTQENRDFNRLAHQTLKKWLGKWSEYKHGTELRTGRSSQGVWIEFPEPDEKEKDKQTKMKM